MINKMIANTVKMYGVKLCSSIVLVLALSGCVAPPLLDYTDSITANSSSNNPIQRADVYWGVSRQDITAHVGTTPYNQNVRSISNVWPAGYYKIVKSGFKPAIIKVERSAELTRSNTVELIPLPKQPAAPQFYFPDAKEAAITDLAINADRKNSFYINKKDTIAVVAFKEPNGSGAGSLLADNMILDFLVKGYDVVDREQVQSAIRKESKLSKGKVKLTDSSLLKKIAQLNDVDYIIHGAITEYVAKHEKIQILPKVIAKDRARYVKERDEFIAFYDEFSRDFDLLPTMPKPIEELEQSSGKKPQNSAINIARVGVTVSIINVKTSEEVWVGSANLQDLGIQAGMRRLVKGLNHSFTSAP